MLPSNSLCRNAVWVCSPIIVPLGAELQHAGVLLFLAHLELLASGAKVAKVQDRSELHSLQGGRVGMRTRRGHVIPLGWSSTEDEQSRREPKGSKRLPVD